MSCYICGQKVLKFVSPYTFNIPTLWRGLRCQKQKLLTQEGSIAAEQSLEAEPFNSSAHTPSPMTGGVRSVRRRYDSDGNLSDDQDVSYMPGATAKQAVAKAAANALAFKRGVDRCRHGAPCARRGKGTRTGAAKLEWGTRLVIYSLLAMMVPCSAIALAWPEEMTGITSGEVLL